MEHQSFIQVEQVNHPMMGFSGTTVCFIFTNLCFLFWANLLGILGGGAALAIGLIQLGMVIAYHLAASKVFVRGQAFDGNIFLIFATFFGGVGGLSNIATAIAPIIGIPYEGTAVGYCWVMCGIFLIAILPACLKSPWVVFVLYALAGLALLLLGLVIIGILNAGLSTSIGWMLFAVGVLGLYMTLSGMYSFVGMNLPLGRPLKK